MTRRAVAKLAAAGLLVITQDRRRVRPSDLREALRRTGRVPQDGRDRARIEYYLSDPVWPSLDKKWVRPRYMHRTPLGHAIVQEYEPLLREPGRPIRWDARLDRAMDAARITCGQCG